MKDNEMFILRQFQEGLFWLQQENYERAFVHFKLLNNRISQHDPQYNLCLSYYGLMLVLIGQQEEGLNNCRRAASLEFCDDQVFYNLARAAIECKNRRCALNAISQGKLYNPVSQLLNDLRKSMGVRRSPIVTFFDRSNFINKFLGKFTYKKNFPQILVI